MTIAGLALAGLEMAREQCVSGFQLESPASYRKPIFA
jgi:hypothetical protein